jgi:hypothetical protein
MDPELLQQLFAQQDATANPPRSSEGGSAGGIMELLGMVGENVALGQDPTGLSSLAQDPEREMLLVQLASGLMGPGIPAAAASKVFNRVNKLMGDLTQENLIDIVEILAEEKDQIRGAIHGATTEDIVNFNKVGGSTDQLGYMVDDISSNNTNLQVRVPSIHNHPDVPLLTVHRGQALTDLVDNSIVGELAARTLLEGDPLARGHFSVVYGNDRPDFLSAALQKGGEIISKSDEGSRVFFPEFAKNRMNEAPLNAQLANFFLDVSKGR